MAVFQYDPTKKSKVGSAVQAAVAAYKPTAPTVSTNVTKITPKTPYDHDGAVTMVSTGGGGAKPTGINGTFGNAITNVANQVKTAVAPPVAMTAQDKALAPFGGKDKYIQDQLARFQGGNATLQGKINTDLGRFGVTASPITGRPDQPGFTAGSLAGATIGNEGGVSYFQLPDGSREWIDTPAEMDIANQISTYQNNLSALDAQKASELAQNQSDYDYITKQLAGQEAVDLDYNQRMANRFGGLYSGGLIQSNRSTQDAYAEQRGQLAQQFQRANQALQSKYGAQTAQMADSIRNLLSTAPQAINSAISQAVAEKRNANIQAAQDFYKTYGYAVKPQDDYSGFFRQVASGQAGLGQKEQLELDKFTAEQQEDYVDNLWKASDSTGVISQALADLYPGVLTAGESTRAAREFAEQQGLRQDAADLDWIREQRMGIQSAGQDDYMNDSDATAYLKSLITVTDPTTKKQRITANPENKEAAFVTLLDSGVDPRALPGILAKAGFTGEEIKALQGGYPEAFQ